MKKILPLVLGVIAIAALTFYGGMIYSGKKGGNFNRGNIPGLVNKEGQQRLEGMGGFGAGKMAGGQRGVNFIGGEIIAKDDKSVTVKLPDGGSKILFFSASTEITKSASGSSEDLQIGQTISANGETNDDGSVNAKTIQLRPKLETPPAPQQ